MKPLASASNGAIGDDQCAVQVLTIVPMVMRSIRKEMHSRRPEGLSVPQFRALGFMYRRGGASLSDMAERMGLALPTASRMVDTLVKRGFVARETSASDRRRVVLSLTGQGRSAYHAASRHAQARLEETLSVLSSPEREEIGRAMETLRKVFAV